MADDLMKLFKDPTNEYRSAPFWSWNDRMDPKEVRRQVRDMNEHGMGGFFMHSRIGLETPYMDAEWMDAIHAAVDEAKKLKMNAWLYDEDRWPSGSAGGKVSAKGFEYQSKRLRMSVDKGKGAKTEQKQLKQFAVKTDGLALVSARDVTGESDPKLEAGEKLATFCVEAAEPTPWHNNQPYSDNLSAESVRAFLEINYKPYVEALKDDIPKTVPGIFTDEPNVRAGGADEPASRVIPWTTVLPEWFRQHRGYDLLAELPAFFLDTPRSAKIRHDYWKTVTELFVTNFSKQLGEYCRANGLAMTGHYNQEGSLLIQMHESGATMPNYVWQDAPGIDILTEQASEFLTAKQCSSVATQFGRKWVLSELYGCTGWEFTFEGIKWVGDWEYALGVTLRCPHLTLYTLRGMAKRDYPPSFNYNNTWWKYNKVHEDYFARIGVMMTRGEAARDILLVHPIASAWCEYDYRRRSGPSLWNKRMETVQRTLLGLHRDYDFGDEMILEQFGSVKDGKLVVEKASYPIVVLPPMRTLAASTAKLLGDFLDSGGKVVAVKPLPVEVDAVETKLLDPLWKHANMTVVEHPAQLGRALDEVAKPRLQVREMTGQELEQVLSHLRVDASKRILFLCSIDRDGEYQAEVALNENGSVEEWDPLTAQVNPVPAVFDGEKTLWRTTFGPAGSRLFVLDTAKKLPTTDVHDTTLEFTYRNTWMPMPGKDLVGGSGIRRLIDDEDLTLASTHFFGPSWEFRRTDPNVLTLDHCRWTAKGSKLSPEMPVWEAQRALREKLGLRPVWDNGGVQRWTWVHDPKDIGKAPAEFHFTFDVREVPKKRVKLLLEESARLKVKLNGKKVAARPGA